MVIVFYIGLVISIARGTTERADLLVKDFQGFLTDGMDTWRQLPTYFGSSEMLEQHVSSESLVKPLAAINVIVSVMEESVASSALALRRAAENTAWALKYVGSAAEHFSRSCQAILDWYRETGDRPDKFVLLESFLADYIYGLRRLAVRARVALAKSDAAVAESASDTKDIEAAPVAADPTEPVSVPGRTVTKRPTLRELRRKHNALKRKMEATPIIHEVLDEAEIAEERHESPDGMKESTRRPVAGLNSSLPILPVERLEVFRPTRVHDGSVIDEIASESVLRVADAVKSEPKLAWAQMMILPLDARVLGAIEQICRDSAQMAAHLVELAKLCDSAASRVSQPHSSILTHLNLLRHLIGASYDSVVKLLASGLHAHQAALPATTHAVVYSIPFESGDVVGSNQGSDSQ